MKQNGTGCAGSIFVPPADAEQSCIGLLDRIHAEPYKHNPISIFVTYVFRYRVNRALGTLTAQCHLILFTVAGFFVNYTIIGIESLRKCH